MNEPRSSGAAAAEGRKVAVRRRRRVSAKKGLVRFEEPLFILHLAEKPSPFLTRWPNKAH
jgi:hypothetical protein